MKGMIDEFSVRLSPEKNIWIATVRQDGRPHLTPVWFILSSGKFIICISERSVKAKNLVKNRAVSLALEDGSSPVICEGEAEEIQAPWPEEIVEKFKTKYDWDITTDHEYDLLIGIKPTKWLHWG